MGWGEAGQLRHLCEGDGAGRCSAAADDRPTARHDALLVAGWIDDRICEDHGRRPGRDYTGPRAGRTGKETSPHFDLGRPGLAIDGGRAGLVSEW